jgi:hypothetical protein
MTNCFVVERALRKKQRRLTKNKAVLICKFLKRKTKRNEGIKIEIKIET